MTDKLNDRARFERDVLVHLPAAHHLARVLLRVPADAEDAVQDACLRAYRAYHQLAGDSPKPWLLAIVRNVCYRRLQDRRRFGNVVSLDEALSGVGGALGGGGHDPALTAPGRTPEQATVHAAEVAGLTAAIAGLPPVFREVIVLRELEELSYREIADVIGAPIGTVMSRLSCKGRSEIEARGLDRR